MNLPSSLVLIAKSLLGIEKLKTFLRSFMMSLLDDLNSFIRNRVTTKSNDFESALGKKKTI